MGGSKKGERRGGARPGRTLTKRKPGRQGGRQKGTGNKPKFDPASGVMYANRQMTLSQEQEREMYFLTTGKRQRMPKDVMMSAMRYFEETALDYFEVARANMEREASAPSPEARAIYQQAATTAETLMREYLVMSVDVAYKVAPFFHARLSAIAVASDSGGPLNAVQQLMKDLDEAGRTPRYIDHDPDERPASAD